VLKTANPANGQEYSLCYHEIITGAGRNAYHQDGVCQKFESVTLEDITDAWGKLKSCEYKNFLREASAAAKKINGINEKLIGAGFHTEAEIFKIIHKLEGSEHEN